jgi:hypothetical protein
VRYVRAQFASPSLGALSMCFLVIAMVSFPRRMQHYAANNAYKNQADTSQYKIRSCAQSGETGAKRLVARSSQEV